MRTECSDCHIELNFEGCEPPKRPLCTACEKKATEKKPSEGKKSTGKKS